MFRRLINKLLTTHHFHVHPVINGSRVHFLIGDHGWWPDTLLNWPEEVTGGVRYHLSISRPNSKSHERQILPPAPILRSKFQTLRNPPPAPRTKDPMAIINEDLAVGGGFVRNFTLTVALQLL